MSRRKRNLLAVGLLVALSLGWVAMIARVLTRTELISAEKGGVIEEGMTREAVHSLLGSPPGNYSSGRNATSHDRARKNFTAPTAMRWSAPHASLEEWETDTVFVMVFYDRSGIVTRRCVHHIINEPTVFDRLRRWLGH